MIINELILVVYGIGMLLLTDGGGALVVPFLLGIIGACVCYLGSSRWFGVGVAAAAGAAAFFWPGILMFYPLLAYGVLEKRAAWSMLLWAAPAIIQYRRYPFPVWLFLFLGISLAWQLCRLHESYMQLLHESRRLQDDSAERNLLLAEKNKNLIETQDYEIETAILQERTRIAREIHDNVGHVISRALIMVGALKTVNKEESIKEPLEQLNQSLSSAMDTVRESVHDLHEESVDLREVLTGLLDEFEFCPVSLIYDMGVLVPKQVKYSFIAIVKEALVNVRKHSNATKVTVISRSHPAFYQLSIEDNGKNARGGGTGGIGLKSMEERIRALGGNLQIHRAHGFCIFITVPRKDETA